MNKIYNQVSQDRYDLIMGRYQQFQENLTNPDAEPVRVFDPLDPKLLAELEMIRGISRELQAKKEEDMKKAAQAAAASQDQEEEVKPETETQAEENKE